MSSISIIFTKRLIYAVAGRTRDKNDCVLLSLGAVKIASGLPSSTTYPSAIKMTRSATSRAKPI